MNDQTVINTLLVTLVLVSIVLVVISFTSQPRVSIDNTDGCVIVTEYGTVLTDPVPGEDDGAIYCPTGEYSSSQLGRITR